jgi:hypothetical protein
MNDVRRPLLMWSVKQEKSVLRAQNCNTLTESWNLLAPLPEHGERTQPTSELDVAPMQNTAFIQDRH